MSDKKLRSKLIRLAYQNPELREDILPILSPMEKEAKFFGLAGDRPENPSRKSREVLSLLGKLNKAAWILESKGLLSGLGALDKRDAYVLTREIRDMIDFLDSNKREFFKMPILGSKRAWVSACKRLGMAECAKLPQALELAESVDGRRAKINMPVLVDQIRDALVW